MSRDIIILAPNGRRIKVHCTPDTSFLQVLEDVCEKQGYEAGDYDLKHHNHIVDLTTTIRFCNIPNKATLEMVEAERKRVEANVTVDEAQDELSDLPDDFYELSIEEVRKIYHELQQKRMEMENTPLMTTSKRAELNISTPLKKSLDPKTTLLEAKFVPCVHMHFRWLEENSGSQYLKQEIYSRKTSSDAASILASKYRNGLLIKYTKRPNSQQSDHCLQ
ncbi:unnamed protein product, partial [Leptidea sinapis]